MCVKLLCHVFAGEQTRNYHTPPGYDYYISQNAKCDMAGAAKYARLIWQIIEFMLDHFNRSVRRGDPLTCLSGGKIVVVNEARR